jgi:hypothetical protein
MVRGDRLRELPARHGMNRPVHFVHIHEEYGCAWCEIKLGKLMLLAHQPSASETRIFNFPGDAEIIGEAVAIATRLRVSPEPANAETSALLGQS